jgi:hypothetical protein
MTAANESLQEFATMCGVSVTDAKLFVELVATGMRNGMNLEEAIERGRNAIVMVLANIQRNPRAARQLVVELYDDIRAAGVTA